MSSDVTMHVMPEGAPPPLEAIPARIRPDGGCCTTRRKVVAAAAGALLGGVLMGGAFGYSVYSRYQEGQQFHPEYTSAFDCNVTVIKSQPPIRWQSEWENCTALDAEPWAVEQASGILREHCVKDCGWDPTPPVGDWAILAMVTTAFVTAGGVIGYRTVDSCGSCRIRSF